MTGIELTFFDLWELISSRIIVMMIPVGPALKGCCYSLDIFWTRVETFTGISSMPPYEWSTLSFSAPTPAVSKLRGQPLLENRRRQHKATDAATEHQYSFLASFCQEMRRNLLILKGQQKLS